MKNILLFFFLFSFISLFAEDEFSVVFFDSDGFAEAALKICKEYSPDLLILSDIKDVKDLKVVEAYPEYIYQEIFSGEHSKKYFAIFAKQKPISFQTNTKIKYSIKKQERTVQRGIPHLVFNISNYKFHIVSAHLKNQIKHSKFSQSDMRRYEARQLRYYMRDLIKDNPKINLLFLGNLNDAYSKSPVTTIFSRRSKTENELFDLRPIDSNSVSWTKFNSMTDEYSRYDYVFSSFEMLQEINYEKSFVIEDKLNSQHRPIFITFSLNNRKTYSESKLADKFPRSIRK